MRRKMAFSIAFIFMSNAAFASQSILKDAAYLIMGPLGNDGLVKSGIYHVVTRPQQFSDFSEQGRQLAEKFINNNLTMGSVLSDVTENPSCVFSVLSHISFYDKNKNAFTADFKVTVNLDNFATYEVTKTDSGESIGVLAGGENFYQADGVIDVPGADKITKRQSAMTFPTLKVDPEQWLAAAKRLSSHCQTLTSK